MKCQGDGHCYNINLWGNFDQIYLCKLECKLTLCTCCSIPCPKWYLTKPHGYCQICHKIGNKKRRLIELNMACNFCHKKISKNNENTRSEWNIKNMHKKCWMQWIKNINIACENSDDIIDDGGDDLEYSVQINPDISIKNIMPDWTMNITKLNSKESDDGQWKQEHRCVNCRKQKYVPIYSHGYRSLCTNCFRDYKNKLAEVFTL